MRFIKIFFGIVLCICTIGFLSAAAQVELSMRAYFIVLACICLAGAVLLLKGKRKEKVKNREPQIAEGDFATVQTEYTPSEIPDDIANEMRKHYTLMQAQRDAEIMAESFRLASTTTNLETFCMRYDLAMRNAHTLLQAEQVGVRGIKKLNCHNACIAVINSANSLKVRALHDFASEGLYQADGLKTAKGKCNRYTKMLLALEKAETTFMFMEEYDALIEELKDRIAQIGTPTTTQK